MSKTKGTVKWFNHEKGYGFIVPSDGGKDIFVHISDVQASGLKGLEEGQSVSFDLQEKKGKVSAFNISVAE